MDDHYQYVDTEVEIKKSSPKSKVKSFFGKFFLAIIAIGLIALLVFQIMIIAATSSGIKATGGAVVDPTPTPADDPAVVPDTPVTPTDDTTPVTPTDDTTTPEDPADTTPVTPSDDTTTPEDPVVESPEEAEVLVNIL